MNNYTFAFISGVLFAVMIGLLSVFVWFEPESRRVVAVGQDTVLYDDGSAEFIQRESYDQTEIVYRASLAPGKEFDYRNGTSSLTKLIPPSLQLVDGTGVWEVYTYQNPDDVCMRDIVIKDRKEKVMRTVRSEHCILGSIRERDITHFYGSSDYSPIVRDGSVREVLFAFGTYLDGRSAAITTLTLHEHEGITDVASDWEHENLVVTTSDCMFDRDGMTGTGRRMLHIKTITGKVTDVTPSDMISCEIYTGNEEDQDNARVRFNRSFGWSDAPNDGRFLYYSNHITGEEKVLTITD